MTDQPKVTAESPRQQLIAARNNLRAAIVALRGGHSAVMDSCDEAIAELDIAIVLAASSGVSAARDLSEGLAHQVLDAEREIEALTASLQQLRNLPRQHVTACMTACNFPGGDLPCDKPSHYVVSWDDVLKTLEGK